MSAVFTSTGTSVDDSRPLGASLRRAGRIRPVVASMCITAVVVMLLAACGGETANNLAQPLAATTVDGSSWRLSDQKGSWVVVAFQAEWCVPCRKEVKELAALQESHPEVQIVTVGFMATPEQTKRFSSTTGVNWTSIPDPDGDISSQWKVTAIPAAFLITPDGQVQKKYVGTLTENTLATAIAAGATGAASDDTGATTEGSV